MIAYSALMATFPALQFRQSVRPAQKQDRVAAGAAADHAGPRRRPRLPPGGGQMPASGGLPGDGERFKSNAA